eukprot:Protomagalhaensia_wolfi_Nauph_80__5850@NODE_744_length_2038_cov_815_972486_g489_i3_p2_GENE_NODE_744_length_2038_cov_815_972486_g489_i3NODE_744_length_2038_cov_815_972486_g489_i3_p2_ORF_typecomplete_len201_score18_02Thioredoxin/PF00085_20/4_7e02Thioredoxin/PF00085_20/2_3e10Thioredoxin_8/PF13905_6/5_7e03Thioredoxin_8/PF13905_6/2_3e05Redoxin/PF08534_10/0_00043AhpCTSA/PF00578_21/0_004Thioredoxin_7/PF13899_6/0_0072TraF/PF13728_6/0_016DUF953/PF06110_11/0_024Thioredoxin_9/PF14595_6/0_023Thioredoxin_2/P
MVCIGPFCFNFVHGLLLLLIIYTLVKSYFQGNIVGQVNSSAGPSRTSRKYLGEAGRQLKETQTKANKVSPYKHDIKSYQDLKKTLLEFQSKYPHLDSTKDRKLVLKFSAAWCGPCRAVEPVIENLRYSCQAAFIHIDVDHTTDDIAKGISSLPTFRVLDWKALSSCEPESIKGFPVLGTHRGGGGVESFVERHCIGFDTD